MIEFYNPVNATIEAISYNLLIDKEIKKTKISEDMIEKLEDLLKATNDVDCTADRKRADQVLLKFCKKHKLVFLASSIELRTLSIKLMTEDIEATTGKHIDEMIY